MLATIERLEADNARLRREVDALRNGQLFTDDDATPSDPRGLDPTSSAFPPLR